MKKNPDFLTTGEAERASDGMFSRHLWGKLCEEHQGFAFRARVHWRIPRSHVERVLRGENAAVIAAEARARGVASR